MKAFGDKAVLIVFGLIAAGGYMLFELFASIKEVFKTSYGLVILSKLENSKSEIRRLIKGNAIKINDEIISDEKLIINHDFFKEDYLKLSIGKKRHLKIVIS